MKLAIIGAGKIVEEVLSFIYEIPNIQIEAIFGRKQSEKNIQNLANKNDIKKYIQI